MEREGGVVNAVQGAVCRLRWGASLPRADGNTITGRMTMDEQQMQRYRDGAEATAREQRRIQDEVDRRDRARQAKGGGEEQEEGAVQAGARKEPENPMPDQHLEKPGVEAEMELRPRYLAPGYKGSEKLKDRVALVTGGDSGIGR